LLVLLRPWCLCLRCLRLCLLWYFRLPFYSIQKFASLVVGAGGCCWFLLMLCTFCFVLFCFILSDLHFPLCAWYFVLLSPPFIVVLMATTAPAPVAHRPWFALPLRRARDLGCPCHSGAQETLVGPATQVRKRPWLALPLRCARHAAVWACV
jgi:hypothetical protein